MVITLLSLFPYYVDILPDRGYSETLISSAPSSRTSSVITIFSLVELFIIIVDFISLKSFHRSKNCFLLLQWMICLQVLFSNHSAAFRSPYVKELEANSESKKVRIFLFFKYPIRKQKRIGKWQELLRFLSVFHLMILYDIAQ